MRCNCPYVVCPYHGNCAACIAHNRQTGDLAHCMERVAMERGAVMPHRLPETIWLEEDYEAMSRRSAQIVCDAVRKKPDALLVLAAGETQKCTYEIIREMCAAGEVDFSRVRFAALDEWLDLADESENCDAFLRRYFYDPMGIDSERVRRFDIYAQDPEQACREMDAYIQDAGGVDLMLLGMGMNGHLGFNEPNSDFSLKSKVVELDSVTMRVGQKYFSNGMKLTRGITLGIRQMFDCGQVVLQISGQHKAEITERMLRTAPTEEIPATVMKLLPHATVVLDRDAASRALDLLEK